MSNLRIKLMDAEKIIFEGEATAISSKNLEGTFDVLEGHSNFITIVKEYVIVHHVRGEKENIKIDHGIIKVENNEVHIFLGVDLV